jgi:hypothetical protein
MAWTGGLVLEKAMTLWHGLEEDPIRGPRGWLDRVGPPVGEPICDMDVWPSPVILV